MVTGSGFVRRACRVRQCPGRRIPFPRVAKKADGQHHVCRERGIQGGHDIAVISP